LITGIVKSEPFEMNKALEDNLPAVTSAGLRQSDVQRSDRGSK
jgi:hypothetical protein